MIGAQPKMDGDAIPTRDGGICTDTSENQKNNRTAKARITRGFLALYGYGFSSRTKTVRQNTWRFSWLTPTVRIHTPKMKIVDHVCARTRIIGATVPDFEPHNRTNAHSAMFSRAFRCTVFVRLGFRQPYSARNPLKERGSTARLVSPPNRTARHLKMEVAHAA